MSIYQFLDYETALIAGSISKLWKKHICNFRLFVKAGHMIFGRDNFYDTQRLREASLNLKCYIPTTLQAKGVTATCIRCIDFIDKVVARWRVSYCTFDLAAHIVKDFLRQMEIETKHLPQEFLKCDHVLLGCGAILIASKFRDSVPLKPAQ